MSDHDFNPGSTDAMFATILTRMDSQAAASKAQADETASFRRDLISRMEGHGKRIEELEGDRKKLIGIAVGTGIGGGGIWHAVTQLFSGNH